MKIATWNVNSLRVRLEHVQKWLSDTQPDVLCLQELKMPTEEFPTQTFSDLGYRSVAHGQKTYNGVAILSKNELTNVTFDLPDYTDPLKRYVAATIFSDNGIPIRIVNVYCPNGQSLDSDKFVYKREWFSKLRGAMRDTLQTHAHTVLVGDFNITPTHHDVHDPQRWQNKIHCSDTERLMLQKLMSEGLYDSFRHFDQDPQRFSWWDYRGAGYRANEGLRIDLILTSQSMLQKATESKIDEVPRQWERPSDHAPVITNFAV